MDLWKSPLTSVLCLLQSWGNLTRAWDFKRNNFGSRGELKIPVKKKKKTKKTQTTSLFILAAASFILRLFPGLCYC